MDLFADIADERRRLADELAGLNERQRATRSLCTEWTVQEMVAHLVVPLDVGLPRFMLSVLAHGGNFHRANVQQARRLARRPYGDLIDTLRRKADSRFTPPGGTAEGPLTDVVVHGFDICRPLGLSRPVPAGRLSTILAFLTGAQGQGLVPPGLRTGIRFEATDLDWAHGTGPAVRGTAEALVLTLTGRSAAVAELYGDGADPVRAALT